MVRSCEGAGSWPLKDVSEVLERRQGIVDAAIVRILKREKSQTLDSIAAMVSGWVGQWVESGWEMGGA